MKKISIIITLFALSRLLNAQFYIRAETGYMFSTHPLKIQSIEAIGTSATVYTMSFKYGQGVPLILSFGYNLNSLFSIELSGSTHISSSFETSTDRPDLSSSYNLSINGFFGDIKYQSNIFQLAPQLVCHFVNDKITLNIAAGPNLLKSCFTHKLDYTDWNFDGSKFIPLQTYQEVEYTTDLNVGIRSYIGINYQFSSSLSFCMNLVSSYNRCKVIRGEIKRYDIDGADHLGDLTSPIIKSNGDNSKVNFSQTGITVGIKINLFHYRVD